MKLFFFNIDSYEMPELEQSNPPNDYGHYKGSAANHSLIYDDIENYFKNNSKMITSVHEQLDVIRIIEKFYASKLTLKKSFQKIIIF